MTNYWVLQGNRDRWDDPSQLYSEPIFGWSVSGAENQIEVGDGVLIWMANRNEALRGIHAAGKISGEPRQGYPSGWGDSKQRSTKTWFAPLAIHWYLIHNPVSVARLRTTAFKSNLIITMARRTAYPCSAKEFDVAIDLMSAHGPTSLPAKRPASFEHWWEIV